MAGAAQLSRVLRHLHNWFVCGSWHGRVAVSDGVPDAHPLLSTGQWFRVMGSRLNDGLHRWGADDLEDEEFDGWVLAMAVPDDLLALVDEIAVWERQNAKALASPLASESFNGYSYTLKGSGTSSGSGYVTWESQFKSALDPWRKVG